MHSPKTKSKEDSIMYQVTLEYGNTTITKTSSIFNEALADAWIEMYIIALTKYNAVNDGDLAIQLCREGTRKYCKILGGN